eukprot:2738446-Amphidinium_carterae.1
MPGLVTILCHAKCLGAWTSFWAPCRSAFPIASKFTLKVEDYVGDPAAFSYHFDPVTKSDICSWRWH